MWDPTKLSNDQVKVYLQKVFEIFGKKSGISEEVALKYLVFKDFNVI